MMNGVIDLMLGKAKAHEIDMCHGPLGKKIIVFALPLILSGMLQLLFNAADVIVVGRFTGSAALAAVGSTGPLINLLTNLFVGLSVGANVLVARYIGANSHRNVSETVHTAMLLSVIGGLILTALGVFLAKPALHLMSSPEDVIDLSTLYLRIYFAGMPATLVYNFGSAILRAVGDTKRPLYYLIFAGIINVMLNLFFVIVLHMSVEGVALATILSQIISAALIVRCLMLEDGSIKLELKKLGINKNKLKQILKIGMPAGLQGMLFSLSNIVLQSAINSFGSATMAGSAAAQNIEGFVFMAMNAFHQAAISFTGQNMGAGEYKRVRHILILCLTFVTVTSVLLSTVALIFKHVLLGVYSTDETVISQGIIRMKYICTTYFLCGMMDVTVGVIRGMGYSITPMIVTLIGVCGLRILWVATVFASHRELSTLLLSYPITWGLTLLVLIGFFIVIYRKLYKDKNI